MLNQDDIFKHIDRMGNQTVHSQFETDVLQVISKRRNKANKSLTTNYGRKINEIDVWPDYYHKFFPEWYCDTLMKEFVNIPCMDHGRVVKYNGTSIIISEPYNSTMSDMKELIKFCEQRSLDFIIDGDSAHFPGRCYRIIFRENKEE